jgi:hypothetical protein
MPPGGMPPGMGGMPPGMGGMGGGMPPMMWVHQSF